MFAGQTANRLVRFIQSTLSYQPPRRFWTEPNDGKNRQRKDPLDGERDAIGSIVSAFGEALQHTCSEQLSESPAQINVTS